MIKIKDITLVPKECMSNLIIGVVAVLVFVFATIIPRHLTGRNLDQKIGDVRYRLEEHKNILPLSDALKKASIGNLGPLVSPTKTSLAMAGLGNALKTLHDISGKSAMTVLSIRPDEGEAYKGVHSIAVKMSLKGSFQNFRTLLADLGALPYVDDMEELSIQQEPSGKRLAFKIKIKLAVL
jgi:hypothetical protein